MVAHNIICFRAKSISLRKREHWDDNIQKNGSITENVEVGQDIVN